MDNALLAEIQTIRIEFAFEIKANRVCHRIKNLSLYDGTKEFVFMLSYTCISTTLSVFFFSFHIPVKL